MSKFLKKVYQRGIIHIQSTKNNIIITLTDLQGNTKFWTSAGHLGFKNSRKSTTYASQAAAENLANQAIELGFFSVIIKLKGLGYGKDSAVRALYKSKLTLSKIIEITSLPHNGCRPPKKRRI
jgi:small subunit ribosomal protein S11